MLETERLIIRKFLIQDWLDVYDYLSLPEIYLFEPGNPLTEIETKIITQKRVEEDGFYAVVLKAENKVIGHICFYQKEPLDYNTWELGYTFNPKYHKQGYATESATALVNYGLKVLKIHKIVAFCNPNNVSSWKLMERLGMQKEGYFKKDGFFRRNSANEPIWHDSFAYGILEEEKE